MMPKTRKTNFCSKISLNLCAMKIIIYKAEILGTYNWYTME